MKLGKKVDALVAVSAGNKRLYRTEAGVTRSYPLIDEVSVTVDGKQRLVTVTPDNREWSFNRGAGRCSIH